MKTELDFISGVYEKYAKIQEIRRKRVRTLSLCATLSACACLVAVVSIRTVPILLNGNAKTTEDAAYTYTASVVADRAVEYELYDAELAVEEAEEEAIADASLAAPAATAFGADEKAVHEAQENGERLVMKSTGPKMKSEDSFYGNSKEYDADIWYDGIAYTENGKFTYTLPLSVPTDAVMISLNGELEHEKISEAESLSGAHYGECSEGYYVSFSDKDTLLLLISDTEAVTQDELKTIADSVVYYTEK